MNPTVFLAPDKARLFESGSPMVYSGATRRVVSQRGDPLDAGDAVLLADDAGNGIGWGVFNPVSMFRVRLMQLKEEYDGEGASRLSRAAFMNMPALIRLRVGQAAALRRHLGLPSPHTTSVYRLVNSEGDRLSGCIVDMLGDTAVVQSAAGWVERYRAEVEAAVREASGAQLVVWRPLAEILKEEGVEGGSSSTTPPTPAATTLETARDGPAPSLESNQRLNRQFVAGLCAGKRVLDLCCYSGGFSLAAALAGAEHVTGVDSSAGALQLAARSAELNGISSERISWVKEDVDSFMKRHRLTGEQWDVVVLDPPKLAPNRASLARATNKYRWLNELALRLVAPGGILTTCSCSGAMSQSGTFLPTVLAAAQHSGRSLTTLRTAGAGPDHPLHPAYPEGTYLTCLTFRVL
ncbi:S-adenosyl-L-methionine-dependent methyltransferase [Haematococcus lacustris]